MKQPSDGLQDNAWKASESNGREGVSSPARNCFWNGINSYGMVRHGICQAGDGRGVFGGLLDFTGKTAAGYGARFDLSCPVVGSNLATRGWSDSRAHAPGASSSTYCPHACRFPAPVFQVRSPFRSLSG